MNNQWDMSYLGVSVDLASCPNRCRHCWLGARKSGNLDEKDFIDIAGQLKQWKDEAGQSIQKLGFFSWWREPDYRDDYRELWKLEQELSTPGCAQRFELLSTWRLARDASYAAWAAAMEPKACQITFFGMEENTDWGMRRKGAFQDQLLATEACLGAGIAPRWQLFLTKRCLHELTEFLKLIQQLKLHERCEGIGHKFEVFIGGISPEGCGYEIENLRVEEADVQLIPKDFTDICREGNELLGLPEYRLLPEFMANSNVPNMHANFPCLFIDAAFDVYPNVAEPAEWWRLGNLKTDSIDQILKAYRNETPPGMRANRTIPLSELARRYGEPNSKKLYHKDDLICRWIHQWGTDYMKGRYE